MNFNMHTLVWAAITVGAYKFLPKPLSWAGAAYAGIRTYNSATGSNALGLGGATVQFKQPSMFNGATVAIEPGMFR